VLPIPHQRVYRGIGREVTRGPVDGGRVCCGRAQVGLVPGDAVGVAAPATALVVNVPLARAAARSVPNVIGWVGAIDTYLGVVGRVCARSVEASPKKGGRVQC
jgi:hypothetical protein